MTSRVRRNKPLWLALLPAMAITPALAEPLSPDALLARHNHYRQELKLEPLVWSETLAQSAQAWADQLAATGSFKHSTTPYGENLWMGTAGAYAQADMVDSWGREKQHYAHGVFPNVTTGGVVGHYTQIVWRNTRQVGCGLATGKGSDVLVCQYDPPGNWRGETPY